MKYKNLLLTTAVTLMLTACGTTNEQPTHPDANILKELSESNEAERHYKIKESILKYVFNDSHENFYPKYRYDSPYYSPVIVSGTISAPVKKVLNNIWSKLENKGISGNSEETGLSEDNYRYMPLQYKETLSPVGMPEDLPSGMPKYTGSVFDSLTFQDKVITTLLADYVPTSEYRTNEAYYSYYNTNFTYTLHNLIFDQRRIYAPEKTDSTPRQLLNMKEQTLLPGEDYYKDIPEATLKEWNQVFIDAFKADPFFKQFFEAPAAPTDSSGSTSALAALKGKFGMDAAQFTVNGVAGSQIDLGLPAYVQLKGSVDQDKSTTGTTGLVAYKLGNSVLGVIQSYANSGTGFNTNSRHLESSIVAAHSFGVMFVEGQFGSVSATDVNFNDWTGVRSQVRFGIDTPFGAPFIQLTHRNFGHMSDIVGYVGFELANTEFKADTYSFSTSLLTKVGHHSVHGATGSVDWTAALNLNSGVAFTTNLTLGSALESKAAFNLSLDR